MAEPLLVAKSGNSELCLLPALANRHGLIAGATGTGKTVTLQTLAQGIFAHRRAGVHGRRERRPVRPLATGQPVAEAETAVRLARAEESGASPRVR